ncbi:hypothetical protein P170DRAFT_374167 [Aspergillus steynii IBT 23096]|uniref:Zn(2)-C6 fungal-type domain-containing protein n=1 Tax=Aspergillus steynii IBT 23096 TaxID=1392250 RepID=A0A2I2GPI9_9EURO|nr:uncharacterized protein P170DRAFT_374167 [Aspergillus steynii IBT 23096]PLB54789.1 hypothetical protein P170DRAFT_374167 [Aspergillus steynii IBT 23096]
MKSNTPTPRSCHRCSEKKIRCPKSHPCDPCSKAGADCIYPGPGRAPRRKKRPLKAQLVSRMKSLEEEVQALHRRLEGTTPSGRVSPGKEKRDRRLEVGALLTDDRESRYVTHDVLVGFGRGSGEKVEDLGRGDPQDRANDPVTSKEGLRLADSHPQNGNSFIFGDSWTVDSLSDFHPTPAHRDFLWTAFEENVSPVVMIFHKPSIRNIIMTRSANSPLDRTTEAVIFSIYHAAVTSLDADQCAEILGQDHATLQRHYRYATQQALARANFLQSQSLAVLQAFTLFLTTLRGPEDAAFVWAMTAAVHRMAQGLGLHRDGTHFGLTPFEIEMRRRLWWAIYLLDTRSAEFRGIDVLITERDYDTKLPLNINDSDLEPESEGLEEETGFTDMTFCLVRCEMIVLNRHCYSHSSTNPESNSHGLRLHDLEQLHDHLRHRYLRFCDVSNPLQWVTATVIRLALARSWLLAHLPEKQPEPELEPEPKPLPRLETPTSPPPDPPRDQLLLTAIEVLEFAYLLETDPRTNQWSWLFCAYPQWHAVVFALTELCARPQTALAERVRALTAKVVARWRGADSRQGGVTTGVVLRLLERAGVQVG